MDSLKEIYDAMSQRIKSPIWGYIILTFIAINWKVLYCLFFSNEPTFVKFNYFDTNTDVSSLYGYPITFGLIAALAAPYISNWGGLWATKPINAMRIREVSAAHEVLQAKNKLAAERDNEKAIYEQRLIGQAKRDQQISEIGDEEIRQGLEEKVKSSRAEDIVKVDQPESKANELVKKLVIEPLLEKVNEEARTLVQALDSYAAGKMTMLYVDGEILEINIGPKTIEVSKNRKEGIRNVKAFNFLVENKLIEKIGSVSKDGRVQENYLMTETGYGLADLMKRTEAY